MISAHVGQPLRPSTRRWMFAISLFAVLPMLAFSLLAARSLFEHKITAQHVELRQQADFGARELAREVRIIFATLDSLATSDAAKRADYAALHAHASRIVALSPRIGGIAAVDADGVARFSTLVPFGVTMPVITASDTDKKALATGMRQVTPLHVAPLSGKQLVLFLVPVTEDGKVVFILRASMWTTAIAEVVYEQPMPATWVASVIDQNMVHIARSKDAARLVGQPASELTQAAIRAGVNAAYTAASQDGIAMTASVARVPGTPWTVSVAAPTASIGAEVWQAFQPTLWIGLGCALLSALGVWFVARALLKQMQVASDTVTAPDKDQI